MPNLGTPELLLILAIIMLLFGAKKLPELSKTLGQSIREFRQSVKDEKQDEGTV